MSARATVSFGLFAIGILSGMLWWVRQVPEPQIARASDALARGLAVAEVDGVDHLVEHYVAPPGLFSLADQLAHLQIELHPEDRYVAVPDPTLGVGSWIEMTRATPVTVVDAKTPSLYRTWVGTVGALLSEQGIALDGDDRLDPTAETPLHQDLAITITRVGVSEESQAESIPFRSVTRQDPELEKGSSRVAQAGRAGTKRLVYSVTRENGEEVDRRLVRTEIVREPEERIVYEGTKVISLGSGQATWYALRSGMQAAHNTLPFGTKVKVTNVATGKSVDVVINDRGIQGGAVIDLTADAFKLIAPLGVGRISVRLEKDYD